MFGNALGWIISALIVAATAGGIAWVDLTTRATPADAFGLDPANSAALQLPAPAGLGLQTSDASTSADPYRDAIDQCIARLDAYESFSRRGVAADIENVQSGLDALRKASAAGVLPVFASSPDELITYENVKPRLGALDLLGRVAIRAAMLQKQSDPASAKELLRAVIVLGYCLFHERLTYEELDCGLRHMAEATAAMISLEQASADTSRATELQQFNEARLALVKTRVLPMAARIRTTDGNIVAANAGNVRHWSAAAGDRVWRVESALALGRARYFVGVGGTLGDQRAAVRALNVLKNDPDPVVRLAAERAFPSPRSNIVC